jgi:hypothetical protein
VAGYHIPDVDGVPAIAFAAGFAADITLATADVFAALAAFGSPQWGFFLGGAPVVVAESVAAFEYRQEFLIADYPMEGGAFGSYNKVQTPYDVRIRFVAGESAATRSGLLASIQAIIGDTNLYDGVMPEQTFPNLNLMHMDFHRTATNGVGLLTIDVYAQQIMQASMVAAQSTAAASGASPVSLGTVQASPYTGRAIGPV